MAGREATWADREILRRATKIVREATWADRDILGRPPEKLPTGVQGDHTSARLERRLTEAEHTPGHEERALSTAPLQAAHDRPPTCMPSRRPELHLKGLHCRLSVPPESVPLGRPHYPATFHKLPRAMGFGDPWFSRHHTAGPDRPTCSPLIEGYPSLPPSLSSGEI